MSHWSGMLLEYKSHRSAQGDWGVGRALAKGRDCHPRARGAEVAVNEGRAPLEMKGTW